jgi:hypothetical protein
LGRRGLKTALTALFVCLLAADCGGGGSSGASGKLETLSSVAQFQKEFDAERGTARLVILLSPT